MNEKSKNNIKYVLKNHLFESTSLIAIITLLLYMFSFVLKLGYYSAFRIPSQLVQFNLNNIAIFVTDIIGFFIALLIIAYAIIISIPLTRTAIEAEGKFVDSLKQKGFSEKIYNYIMGVTLLILSVIALVILFLYYKIIYLLITLSIIAVVTLLWILFRMDNKYYIFKVSVFFLSGICIFYISCLLMGERYARQEEVFPVTSIDNDTYLIIDVYEKDRYIVKKLEDKKVHNTFRIVDMKTVEDIEYKKVFDR